MMPEALLPLVQTLGWTLFHFLWQGLLVGLLIAGGLSLLRHGTPQARYALACGGLLVMLVLPVATWWSWWSSRGPMVPTVADMGEGARS
ncbi:MAG: hypothetical protein IT369_05305 [Candidatus Latescibacteria bacterium]|nr:hypothetical protein [Candidatus Latescibacterota bacterium]